MNPESLAEFLSWKPPYIKEIIGNRLLIPQGKMIIFGPKKSWKSMTSIDLAFKLATGHRWLGFRTTQCRVLAIQLEIAKFAYQERVTKYAMGNKLSPLDNLFFMSTRNLKLDKPWGVELLKQWITYTRAEVVIVDPAYKVISGRLTDEWDVRQFTDRMDEVAEVMNVAIVIVNHEGKFWLVDGEKYDRGADAQFGSDVFGWWCDSSIELKAEYEGSNKVHVRFPLLRLSPDDIKPIDMVIDRSNLVFSYYKKEEC